MSSADRLRTPVSKSPIGLGAAAAGVEVRHLRYVVAAADEGSFRRAATALGVEQSAISRRIRDVEDRLGVSLFTRHSGGVDLTNAGKRFLGHARHALRQIDRAAKLAGSAGRGERGIVRVGIVSSLASGFIADLLKEYERANAGVHIEYIEGAPSEHVAAVRRFKIDVAFVTARTAPADCETEQLWTEKVFVVLPSDHRLVARKVISWSDLKNEHFLVSETDPGPEIHDFLVKNLADLGQHASVESCAVGRDNLMQIVSFGRGLSLTSEATTGTQFPGVVYRPLSTDELPFRAVWSPKIDNPALRRLLSLARTMAKRHDGCGQTVGSVRSRLTTVRSERSSMTRGAPSQKRDRSP